MPVIKVNHRDVHIQELNKGAAETVLLIHGMFSNLSVYYFNIAPVLAEHFHVVMYDLKSHGMSERTLEGYDLNSMTDDLYALMEVLKLEKVHLAGYSFGGLIALKMAVRFPEKLRKLVLIEAPDPNDDKTRGIIEEYSREFLEHYVANFTDTTKVKMGKRQMDRNHRMYEYLFYQTSIKKDMIQESGFFSAPEINTMQKDTLLLYGSASNCLEAGKQLHQKIRKSDLIPLDGDHNIPIQEPVMIAEIVSGFFKN
ncbi:alpha/beta hydrolase [Pedobacter lusitanus]|uniref:Alpha/beta hydrolase n=1 Tax=Pedobacter lusitanus TaxID=1503925 RepID=A0A0D0GWL8_9SPHI|nr:alpha/beta fold hydrolase [Pedobacter lusitanus]KIO78801.1 alpha/beta hydrolase [Pedobacter lusitanus]